MEEKRRRRGAAERTSSASQTAIWHLAGYVPINLAMAEARLGPGRRIKGLLAPHLVGRRLGLEMT
jgi:hypothetical protein